MSFHARLVVLIVFIVGLLLVPYLVWHEPMDAYFASAEYQQWLCSIKPYAWLIGPALLAADAFLPGAMLPRRLGKHVPTANQPFPPCASPCPLPGAMLPRRLGKHVSTANQSLPPVCFPLPLAGYHASPCRVPCFPVVWGSMFQP
jgi:hypothetical protein